MPRSLLRWFLFSVLLALLPLGFAALAKNLDGELVSVFKLVSGGELLLVSVGITGAAVGDLLGRKRDNGNWELAAGWCSVVLVALTAFYYSRVDSVPTEHLHRLVSGSLYIFVASIMAGAVCVLIGNMGET